MQRTKRIVDMTTDEFVAALQAQDPSGKKTVLVQVDEWAYDVCAPDTEFYGCESGVLNEDEDECMVISIY